MPYNDYLALCQGAIASWGTAKVHGLQLPPAAKRWAESKEGRTFLDSVRGEGIRVTFVDGWHDAMVGTY